jgi:two-component system, NtrC family, nitrogen regulation response regulator GlnG
MKRVLLVDKNNVYRQVLALVLKWNTELKESAEADSLTQARRILGSSKGKPDLAIVNLNAAKAEGFELMKELRMSAPEVPVLAITLERDVEQRNRALRAGAREVLTMDVSPKEIVDAAKRLVGE